MFDCKILADSISDHDHRLTTFEITLPRIVLAEFNTHRMFSRNSASSRAIPVAKSIQAVRDDPFFPSEFGSNQRGMVSGARLEDRDHAAAESVWQRACGAAILNAERLEQLGVHKGLANRILEPYKWQTIIVTATDWDNFFALRCHENAQGEIRTIAEMMREQYYAQVPDDLHDGWHMPLVTFAEISQGQGWEYWKKVSIGRCARVSYLTHDGRRDPDADIVLYYRLLENGHMSPFEHVARPFTTREWLLINDLQFRCVKWSHTTERDIANYLGRQVEYAGNFRGWWSARMDIPHQENYALH